jgi:hypothetical protein
VTRAFVYVFSAVGASSWIYTGVIAGGPAAIACLICAALSAAVPWAIEEHAS